MKKTALTVAGGVVILAGVVALAWWGMGFVPANVVRLWALLATAALPLVGWFGYWLGGTESRGVMHGLDKGIDKIFGPTVRATRRRGYMGRAQQYTQPIYTQAQAVILPEVEFTQEQIDSTTVEL